MGDGNGVNGDPNANQNSPSTGNFQLETAVQQWLSWDKNPWTRAQVESLVAAGQIDNLSSRLGSRMSFGTAGLRAPMGAGFNRINDLTIIQSTQGLCSYLSRFFADLHSRGVVVGFDTRGQQDSGCSSQRLATLTAAVLLSRDVPVHLFSKFVPTPFVVYWCNGAQISSPHDKEILLSIEEHLEPWSASCWDEGLVEKCSLRTDPLDQINSCYMEELTTLCYHRDLNIQCPLKFVHSSFHGVGHDFIQQAFQTFGFTPPIPVLEQKDPDPNFSTIHVPNPEEGESVLELSFLLAEKENARIVLATDPDADRLAVAEKSGWKVFTGNELAALLGWWMFFNWKENHPSPADTQRVYMLATTVSSKILQTLANMEGFHFEETLPGFKWIGNRIHELSKTGNPVIFAFEESIGFLCGSMVPEKDGVSAAVVVAEMAAYLQEKNLSLNQQLNNIYQMYGYHLSKTSYVICRNPPTIKKIFHRIRNFDGDGSYPKTCAGIKILNIRDITTGYDSSRADLRSVFPVSKSSQMITFMLQNGIVATLRSSGTEPKIKYYTEFCAAPGKSDVSSLEEELRQVTDALLIDFLEPEKNNLTGCLV
uniref:Phosphoglucomutase 2-like 1 n=1 Tax=Cynoglossus semilaevis TaxID=244447 RepID=A0A3P8VAJ0_CYNSE